MTIAGLLLAVPAAAQEQAAQAPAGQFDPAPDPTAVLITTQREAHLPAPKPRYAPCREDESSNDIVVCRNATQTERYRVPSSADDDPSSAGANRTGVPHVRQSLVTGMADCGPGHRCKSIGRAPAPIYYFDLSKLPMAPAGSDADKIAKGEMRAP